MYCMPEEFLKYTKDNPEIPFDTYPEDLEIVPNGFSDNCPKNASANISVPPWYIGSIYQGGIIRPVTAPFQHYETGVQLLKFKRYSNTRPSTR